MGFEHGVADEEGPHCCADGLAQEIGSATQSPWIGATTAWPGRYEAGIWCAIDASAGSIRWTPTQQVDRLSGHAYLLPVIDARVLGAEYSKGKPA